MDTNKFDKFLAISLLIAGFISNGIGVIVNFIGLVINMLIIGGLYMKFRSKHELYKCAKDSITLIHINKDNDEKE